MSAAKDYTAVPGAITGGGPGAVTLVDPGATLPAPATSLLETIARAARDPAVDVEKIERLLALKERTEARGAERAFNSALRLCQIEMTPIVVDAKSDKGKYATYFALDKVVRPIYGKHGFAVTFSTGESGPESVKVLGWLLHDDGHSRQYEIDMPADGKGPKGNDVMSKTHATFAATTYGKRNLLTGMFNLAIDKDDDGNGAGDGRQTEILFSLIQDASAKETGFNADAFCKFFGVDAVADLPRKDFQRACDMLKRKIGAQKAPEYLE